MSENPRIFGPEFTTFDVRTPTASGFTAPAAGGPAAALLHGYPQSHVM
jgi:hypothetical protein